MPRPYHRNLRDTHSAPTDPMQPHPSFPHRRANAESSWSYLTQKEFQGTLRSRQGCHHRLVWGEAFNVGSTCATAITQATGHRLNCHRGPAPGSLPPTIFFMPVLLFTLFRRNKNLPSIWKKKYSDHSFSFVFLYAHSYCHHQIHGRQSQRTTRRT